MAVAQKSGIPKWVARSVSGNMPHPNELPCFFFPFWSGALSLVADVGGGVCWFYMNRRNFVPILGVPGFGNLRGKKGNGALLWAPKQKIK